jgi:predicted O-methyltransferase YrrM
MKRKKAKKSAARPVTPRPVTLHPVPLLDEPEVRALHALFKARQPARVLEWGGGGSTLYWPACYPAIDWVTLEHNPVYAEALRRCTLPDNVTLIERAYPEYYSMRAAEIGTFDLIIVDGRERVRCLDAARLLLNPGGAAVLHDSSRERYAPARKLYQSVTVLCGPNAKGRRGLWLLQGPLPAKQSAPCS